jgi:hypothetical protein
MNEWIPRKIFELNPVNPSFSKEMDEEPKGGKYIPTQEALLAFQLGLFLYSLDQNPCDGFECPAELEEEEGCEECCE